MRLVEQVVIRRVGGPEVLELGRAELAEPGLGEVSVRHSCIGVNFIDTYHRSGLYPLPRLPHALGMEAVGVVERVGDAVSELSVGDRVAYATCGPGAYATARNVPASGLVRVPPEVDDASVAATLLKGLTVEYLVRRLHRVERGEWVLLHAAAGGVGLIACQWLAHLGARVIGTVGSEAKAELARAHGCEHALLYRSEPDVAARVRELTGGQGVSVAYDSVGRDTFETSLRSLRRRGLLVSFGNASGPPAPLDVLSLSRHGSLFLTRPTLGDYASTRDELHQAASGLFELLAGGVIRPHVGQRLPLRDARQAHEALEARRTVGATLLLPE